MASHVESLETAGNIIRYEILHNYFGGAVSPPAADRILPEIANLASYLEQYCDRLATGLGQAPTEFSLYLAAEGEQRFTPAEHILQAVNGLRAAKEAFHNALFALRQAETATTWVGVRDPEPDDRGAQG